MRRPIAGLAVLLTLVIPARGLAQAGSIGGRVIGQPSGQPVRGAQIHLFDAASRDVASAESDGSGRFRLERIAAGTYRLTVRAIQYAPRSVIDIRVAPGSAIELNLELASQPMRLPDLEASTPARTGEAESVVTQPVAVTVIPGAVASERTALTVADHLKDVRGVAISEGGLVQSNIVARGFNNIFSGSLLTLIDFRYAGVPSLRVNVPAFFPVVTDDVEQVELVLGPGAALYGPNATSGILHVITKSPITSQGTTVTLESGFRAGTPGPPGTSSRLDGAEGVYRVGLRHATRLSSRVGFKVSGEYLSGTDWRFADPGDTLAPGAVAGSKTVCRGQFGCRDFGLRRWGGEARLDIRPTSSGEWITSFGMSNAVSLLEPTAIGTAQAKGWKTLHVQSRFRQGKLFLQAFLNQSDAGETFLLRDGSLIVDESRLWSVQGQQGFDLGRRASLVFGADLTRTDPRTGGTINGSNENVDGFTEVGGYLHGTFRLSDRLDLVSAFRVDHHSRIEQEVLSPRLALVFKPSGRQSLRLTYNRAFSTPTSTDLFLDIAAGDAGPYTVRALGVPSTGFHFRAQGGCAGGIDNLCMRSPFAPDLMPARASLLWQAAVAAVAPSLPPDLLAVLQSIPASSYEQVATSLLRLNPTTRSFDPTSAEQVQDIGALKPTISNVIEAGYQGQLGNRLRLAVDGYYERRENFVGPLIVETPSVFLDQATLVPLLRQAFGDQGIPAAVADQVAAGMLMVPLGTVVPNDGNPLTARPDIILTSRNFGSVDIFGADLAVDLVVNDHLALAGTYSWVNKDLFTPAETDGPYPIALNASRSRASLAARVSSDRAIWQGEARVRSARGFPVSSGVFESPRSSDGTLQPIDGFTVVDLQAGWRPPMLGQRTLLSVTISNLFDTPYATFVGVPRLGRLVMTKVSHSF